LPPFRDEAAEGRGTHFVGLERDGPRATRHLEENAAAAELKLSTEE